MAMYRIFTEQHKKLPDIVSQYFDGFTMLYGKGFWKGKPESCTVIEIDVINADYNIGARIDAIVGDIKRICKQKSVIVQTVMCCTRLY